jgi:hypothetical protein
MKTASKKHARTPILAWGFFSTGSASAEQAAGLFEASLFLRNPGSQTPATEFFNGLLRGANYLRANGRRADWINAKEATIVAHEARLT